MLKKIPKLCLAPLLLSLVFACSKEDGLEGERIPLVREISKLALELPGKKIKMPPVKIINSWPQFLSGATHKTPNIEMASKTSEFESSNIFRVSARGPVFSPIIISDIMYFLDKEGTVHASNINGSHSWSRKVHSGNPKNYSFPGGLAYNEGRLFLSSRAGTVAALNASTGEILWKYSFSQPFRSYPLIYRKNIYVVSGDDLGVAFSRDGKILWSISGDIQTTSVSKSASPLANDGKVFFPFSSGSIHATNFKDGRNFWTRSFNSASIGGSSSLITDFGGSPVITKRGLLMSSFSGQTLFLDFNGKILWETNVGTSVSPLIIEDDAFLIEKNGILVRLSLKAGEVIWSRNLNKKKKIIEYFDPILVNGNIVITGNNKFITVISPEDGTIRKVKRLRGIPSSSPISYKGKVYVPLSNGRVQVF